MSDRNVHSYRISYYNPLRHDRCTWGTYRGIRETVAGLGRLRDNMPDGEADEVRVEKLGDPDENVTDQIVALLEGQDPSAPTPTPLDYEAIANAIARRRIGRANPQYGGLVWSIVEAKLDHLAATLAELFKAADPKFPALKFLDQAGVQD